jgi:hypothetical protein
MILNEMKRFLFSLFNLFFWSFVFFSCDDAKQLLDKDERDADTEPTISDISITAGVSDITNSKAQLYGYANINTDSVEAVFGIIYSTDKVLANGDTLLAQEIDSLNMYSVTARKLFKRTTYYYRSFVLMDSEYYYGEIKSFNTANNTAVPDYVDLGLSVKWATFNVGATSPEEFGDFYAWGETETKTDFSWKTYNFWNEKDSCVSKYCIEGTYVDGKKTLEPNDDVAHSEYGVDWRMPTDDECRELIENCTWSPYNMDGVDGYLFTSKIDGYTDRSIFLPDGGWYDSKAYHSNFDSLFLFINYWTSSNCEDDYEMKGLARLMGNGTIERCYGFLVRAVCPSENFKGSVRNRLYLPSMIKDISDASIFYEALAYTQLRDTLEKYMDTEYFYEDYSSTLFASHYYTNYSSSSVTFQTTNGMENVFYLDRRLFKYTIFVVPDSKLAEKYNIYSVDDLCRYAETIYPEGAGLAPYEEGSSLCQLISYHILPVELMPDHLNPSNDKIIKNRNYLDKYDVEDFYETILPHSVMRISTTYNGDTPVGTYINRKGTVNTENLIPGVKVHGAQTEGKTTIAMNGCFYFVDELLCYDDQTRKNVLDTRMRFMSTTLSPDFINSGARGRVVSDEKNRYNIGFTSDFCKNLDWTDNTLLFVKYLDTNSRSLYGDEVIFGGNFDVTLRLPPVPYDGTYEIRIWNNAASNRNTVCQFYFAGADRDWHFCDIPVILGNILHGRIPFAPDSDYDDMSGVEREAAIQANDNELRKSYYMKSPDIYLDNRNNPGCYRRIITQEEMKSDEHYYLRIRNCIEGDNASFSFSFIEVVPVSVYSGINGLEDRH